jgi:hypothetical protein
MLTPTIGCDQRGDGVVDHDPMRPASAVGDAGVGGVDDRRGVLRRVGGVLQQIGQPTHIAAVIDGPQRGLEVVDQVAEGPADPSRQLRRRRMRLNGALVGGFGDGRNANRRLPDCRSRGFTVRPTLSAGHAA